MKIDHAPPSLEATRTWEALRGAVRAKADGPVAFGLLVVPPLAARAWARSMAGSCSVIRPPFV